MKVQVIYSSLSGSTKKLAQGIYDGLTDCEKSFHDVSDGNIALDGDIILLGYWVDKGGPNTEMENFMSTISGKVVGVFCTLAYFADTNHGNASVQKGVDLLKENNTILGSYVCNGKLGDELIEKFRQAPKGGHHSASPESELRWKMMKNHPTPAEISLGAERFKERVTLYADYLKNDLTYKSIL